MESQNPRTDNAPSMSASGEEVHLPREHTGSTGGNNTKLVPVPYNISSRLPTYEEATANTNLSSNYEQIYNNQSNGVYDFDQQPNLPQLDSSVFPDSGFPQEWYTFFIINLGLNYRIFLKP